MSRSRQQGYPVPVTQRTEWKQPSMVATPLKANIPSFRKMPTLSLEKPGLLNIINNDSVGINATGIVKQLINKDIYLKKGYLQQSGGSKVKGLGLGLALKKDTATKQGTSSSTNHSNQSSLGQIQAAIVPALCIGCAISWASMDLSSIITTAGEEALQGKESFYRLMETLVHFIQSHGGSNTLEERANQFAAEAFAELTEKVRERETQQVLKSISEEKYVSAAAILVGVIILAVHITRGVFK